MLIVLTSIMLSAGSVQATMVRPEEERLTAEEVCEPLVNPPVPPRAVARFRTEGSSL